MATPARSQNERLSTGIAGLDERLGGGLVPGSWVAVVGATGIGKSQLGVHFANAGRSQESRRGVFFDMCSRGDEQGQLGYADRIADWRPQPENTDRLPHEQTVFDRTWTPNEYIRVFDYSGRRVTREQLGEEGWRDWQAEINRKLRGAISFFYSHFVRGVRRVVIDGIEPIDNPADSIQIELLEYIFHQVLRKDDDWVARDLFRESFRTLEPLVLANRYDPRKIVCMSLHTSREVMLEDLISKPLSSGDLLANANTILLAGKIRDGATMKRAMYIAKHRGSECSDEIFPYRIEHEGIVVS